MNKNRVPTVKEVETLRRTIQLSEKWLAELDPEVDALQTEADGYHATLKEMDSVLCIARALQSSAKMTISSLENKQYDDFRKQLDPNADSSNTSYAQLYATGEGLMNISEDETEVNQSLLSCIEQSLLSLVNLREDIKGQIKRMKNMAGAHRRAPDDVWLQIFDARINEDEKLYMSGEREEAPPFTVLKLTWVSQRWRRLIGSQPSLWHYVPIPHVKRLSSGHHARINHALERLRLHPPTVYMVHWNNGTKKGEIELSTVLERIPPFKSLDLYISPENMQAERLMGDVRPDAKNLMLFSSPNESRFVTSAVIAHYSLQKVQHISCINVQPGTRSGTGTINIASLHLASTHIENSGLVTFLEDISVSMVTIELRFPFLIDASDVVTDTTLSSLTTLTTNLTVLMTLFNHHVFLPNLHTLTVTQESTRSSADTRAHWASFITTHERKDTISTLGISSSSSMEQSEALPIYQDFITQVTNLEHPVLEGTAVVLGLMAMVSENRMPPTLVKLTISKSKDVAKDHLDSLSKIVHASQRRLLSLQIKDCPALSDKIEERLILDDCTNIMAEEA
ncbi:hypothetical protein CPB86DRAFT_815219 [Serendipita vermifera]|nr:hypothetical protein CPB86DRAFT_815219 [Serendipita vermifera]